MRYWDSSALMPLLVREAGTRRRQQQIRQDSQIVTWWGTKVECASALNRLAREGQLTAAQLDSALAGLDELAAGWIEIQATPMLQDRALRLLRLHALRAADALQLAAALMACNESPRGFPFLSADSRLAAAARTEGFTMLAEA